MTEQPPCAPLIFTGQKYPHPCKKYTRQPDITSLLHIEIYKSSPQLANQESETMSYQGHCNCESIRVTLPSQPPSSTVCHWYEIFLELGIFYLDGCILKWVCKRSDCCKRAGGGRKYIR